MAGFLQKNHVIKRIIDGGKQGTDKVSGKY